MLVVGLGNPGDGYADTGYYGGDYNGDGYVDAGYYGGGYYGGGYTSAGYYGGYGYGGYGYGGYGYGGCHTAYIPYGWTWYRASSC